MRDQKRIDEVLETLGRIWKKHPDMRMFQLLENLFGCDRDTGKCKFHIEDDKVLERLKEFEENEEWGGHR